MAVVGGAFFVGMKFWARKFGKGKSNAVSDKALEKKLRSAESDLESAQLEINRLKNRDKIKEMERKIEDEKKYLERMKKGY